MSTKKLSKIVRFSIITLSLLLALLFAFGGKILLSLPLILVGLGVIKLKGLTLFQIFNLYRLLQVLRHSGRFSYTNFNPAQGTSSLTLEEAYKILNLDPKKNPTKEDVKKAHAKIQKKIHPDISPETTRLSAIVNEAKDLILKNKS
jgi:hypothetical protein